MKCIEIQKFLLFHQEEKDASEPVSQGCFPIVSNILPNKLLTNNFKFAYYHERDNSNQLAEKLLYACLHEAEIEKLAILGKNSI